MNIDTETHIDAGSGVQDDFPAPSSFDEKTSSHDERRLHLQAFDYWHDLKADRSYPLFSELRAEDLAPFKANSLLFEFVELGTVARFIGAAVGELIDPEMKVGSYLGDYAGLPFAAALTEQFSEEQARSRAVEFEFLEEGLNCRGIMLPFSRDGAGAHFVMVVVSFARGMEEPAETAKAHEVEQASDGADETDAAILRGLLGAAQRAADSIVHMDNGNRSSLYDALASALALYEGSRENRPAYDALLGEAGLKEQSRAPFTPALKLVFGVDYDKTRLTEYAAALSYAVRMGKTSSELNEFLKTTPGGIKGCVQEERAFKRGQSGSPAHNRQKEAEDKLRHLPEVSLKDMTPNEEYCLILARRSSGGGVEALGCADVSRAALDTAIRRLASKEE